MAESNELHIRTLEVYFREDPTEPPKGSEARRGVCAAAAMSSVLVAQTSLRGRIWTARSYESALTMAEPRCNN